MMNELIKNKKGFSLLEILLVLGIAGVLFAVIIPRAWRAKTDANLSLVRQAAVELGKWGMEWSERNMEAQGEADTCTMNNYMATLIGYTGGKNGAADNNWFGAKQSMTCRSSAVPTTVAEIMDETSQPRNPFTGLMYLHASHNGTKVEPGLLYLVSIEDGGINNYYFVFTGAEPASASDWHAGMGDGATPTFEGARNGVFVTRLKP